MGGGRKKRKGKSRGIKIREMGIKGNSTLKIINYNRS
jgi:hypothetical protein